MDLFIWAWLAVGLSWLGVAIGNGVLGKKSIEIMGKNPEMMNSLLVISILWMALVESAAIYGLIIALQITWLDPETFTVWYKAIAAGAAIGAAGFGAGIGEWFLVAGALESIWKNPESKGKILTFMILFLALIESVAIYGLVIALSLLG